MMDERCSLDELFTELALSRTDTSQDSSTFAYPEEDVVELLETLLPSIHSRSKDRKSQYTSGNKYSYGSENRENDTFPQSETIRDAQIENCESSASEATSDSSTLTLKSDMLGDLRPQILNQDFSYTSECSEGISKTPDEEVYKETIIEAPTTDGMINIKSREKSRENVYIGPKKRNEINKIGDIIKSKSNIHLSTQLPIRNILNSKSENHHHIPESWLSQSPIMPAEKEFTRFPNYNLRTMNVVSSNGEPGNLNRQFLKENYSEKLLESEENGKFDSSIWSEKQASTSDKEVKDPPRLTAKARLCSGDIASHFDHCFRCRSSSNLLKRARSDSTISIFKSLKGMRRSCYFRSHETPSKKSSRLGKPTILWAITKINIYPDNSRTYEVMPLSGKRPTEVPDRSDSVFVLIPPKRDQQRCKTAHE